MAASLRATPTRAGLGQPAGCPPRAHCARTTAPHRARTTIVPRAAAATAPAKPDVAAALATVKKGLKPGAVPAPVVLDAMLALENAKLPTDGWLDAIQAPGVHWRLMFTADAKNVNAAKKQQPNKGGIYFPIPACQNFDASRQDFENGVFLGPIASLTFNGPYAMKGRQITFNVCSMNIGLGPWRFSLPLSKSAPIEQLDASEAKKLPFFLYIYADNDIVIARGRSGGLALWARADADWESRAGILRLYK